MSQCPLISLHNLSYSLPNNDTIFTDVSITFNQNRTALIGKNGCGKTTLMQLVIHELAPTNGSVQVQGSIAYCPQDFSSWQHATIADVFAIKEKLVALEHIEHGSINMQDFNNLNDDWLVKERVTQQLQAFGCHYDLWQPIAKLSGGEITRLWLAKVFSSNADFLLLDEPTNNLDAQIRKLLYEHIEKTKTGLIVISHDRGLLALMDQIVELTSKGTKVYGGNYSLYQKQKYLELAAQQRQLNDAKKHLIKTTQSIQNSREKREQRQTQGKQLRKSGSQSALLLDAMQNRATKNQGAMAIREEKLLTKAQDALATAKQSVEVTNEFKLELDATSVPTNKIVISMEHIDFAYPDSKPLFQDFNLTITGPERLAINGVNGCGKTTLIKLLQGKLQPNQGVIYRGVRAIAYLDQNAHILEQEISILDNFKKFNPKVVETTARTHLARFLFRENNVLKKVTHLSGGEKIRAALACTLMAALPPQLIILDEPTNHLDLESIAIIEKALQLYQGALIIISHDNTFIDNIATTRTVSL